MRLCVACALLLSVLVVAAWAKKKNSRFYWKRPSYVMPWTKGPNICAVEEVTGSRKRYYSECMTYMPRRICDKSTFIRYHCCTGFERITEDAKGCEGVAPVENLSDLVMHLYLTEYRKHLKTSGFDSAYRSNGTYTVFVPQNRAFTALPHNKLQQYSSKAGAEELVRYHTVKERHYLRDLVNNIELPTLSTTNPGVRVNRYSNGIVTINCARLVVPDQIASNGILHTTERVIEPFQDRGTIMEILLRDDLYNFGELATALIVTQLGNILRDDTKMFTLFAPTDAAFRNAPPEIVNKILNDKDLLEKLLKYHVMTTEICTAAIIGHATLRTLEGQKVNLTCDVNDHMRVNDIPVAHGDIVATNGVIHVLDEVLVPNAVKSLDEVLIELGMYEFLEYAQQAGVMDELRGRVEGDYTVFVPSLEAFASLPAAERHMLQTQPAAVRRVFQYHVIPGRITTNTIVGESAVGAASGRGDTVLLNVQQGGFSVNDARIVSANHEAQNGVIHVIDRILRPAEVSAIDRVKEQATLSTFMGLLQTANMDGLLLEAEGNYTLFAPTNDAFDALPREYLNRLMGDRTRLSKFLQYHIIRHPIHISVQKPRLQYRYESLTGDWVRMRSDHDEDDVEGEGELTVVVNDYANVVGETLHATNGVIYTIDDILHCPCIEDEGFGAVIPVVPGHENDVHDHGGGSPVGGGGSDHGGHGDESNEIDTGDSRPNTVQQVKKLMQLSSFLAALQSTTLHNILMNIEGNFTVFAPSNEAFMELDSVYRSALLADQTELNKFLRYHVLEHPVYTNVMQSNFPYRYRTMTGDWLKLFKDGSGPTAVITIDDFSTISGGPYPSSNGVVYSINTVLRCPCLGNEV